MPLIRYPGSKAKLLKSSQFLKHMPPTLLQGRLGSPYPGYREPFLGSGAVAFEVMRFMHPDTPVWLNDIDPGIAALWLAVRDHHNELRDMVMDFTPTLDSYRAFREVLAGSPPINLQTGFAKLALHRMSFSGLGMMAGSPIGGWDQSNERYDIQCRWNKDAIMDDVLHIHQVMASMNHLDITCLDFEVVLRNPDGAFAYLDPPYVEKGGQLYQYSFTEHDHRRLRLALNGYAAPWLVAYDDCPLVRELYGNSITLQATYTISVGRNRKNAEVLIRFDGEYSAPHHEPFSQAALF